MVPNDVKPTLYFGMVYIAFLALRGRYVTERTGPMAGPGMGYRGISPQTGRLAPP